MLTIIASMEHELAGLRRELKTFHAGCTTEEGVGSRQICPVVLHVVGVGSSQWQDNVKAILSQHTDTGAPVRRRRKEPRGLLLIGFAGALDPSLQTGDLVLSSRYHRETEGRSAGGGPQEEKRDFREPDDVMWQQALDAAGDAGLPVTHLDSLTVDGLVTTPTAKSELHHRYWAGIVSLEDYWAAVVAKDAGVPFLSARVVLDPASQSLPEYLPGLAQSRSKAVLCAAAMPWRIPALLALGRQMRQAQRVLARFTLFYIGKQRESDSLHSKWDLAKAVR